MKAAVYYENGGPEVLRYEDVPDPVIEPGDALLRVEAIAIQGGDLLNRAGGPLVSTPHIVGYQAAGTIVEVGAQVTGLRVGQKAVVLVTAGSHAELIAASERSFYPVPDELDTKIAAGIPVEFGTAEYCLFEFGHLKAGETVLVQAAAGGVGLASVQLAKQAGATVIGTAGSAQKIARLGEYGVDHVINYREQDVVAEVRKLTDGQGVDLVVDSVGGHTLEGSINALASRGRISWVGAAARESYWPNLSPLMGKNATLQGVYFGADVFADAPAARAAVERNITRAAAGDVKVVLDREFSLSEAAEAHRYIESRAAFGRVLLVP